MKRSCVIALVVSVFLTGSIPLATAQGGRRVSSSLLRNST